MKFPTKDNENHSAQIINQDHEVLSNKTNVAIETKLLNSDHHIVTVAHDTTPTLGSGVQIPVKDDLVAKDIVKPKAKSTKRKRKGGDDDDDGGNEGNDDNDSKAKKMRLVAEEEIVDRNVESTEVCDIIYHNSCTYIFMHM